MLDVLGHVLGYYFHEGMCLDRRHIYSHAVVRSMTPECLILSFTLSISGFPQLLCVSHGTLVIYEVLLLHIQLKVGVLWSIILWAKKKDTDINYRSVQSF